MAFIHENQLNSTPKNARSVPFECVNGGSRVCAVLVDRVLTDEPHDWAKNAGRDLIR